MQGTSIDYLLGNARHLYRVTSTWCLLQAEADKWAGWVVAGIEDAAQLIDEQLHDALDWEDNLKALKVVPTCYHDTL